MKLLQFTCQKINPFNSKIADNMDVITLRRKLMEKGISEVDGSRKMLIGHLNKLMKEDEESCFIFMEISLFPMCNYIINLFGHTIVVFISTLDKKCFYIHSYLSYI